eukprot:m.46815 g.46815  ORF g.46815 m.46815 type:complete len:457 (+) comp10411_c1_seq1:120-1490(+)
MSNALESGANKDELQSNLPYEVVGKKGEGTFSDVLTCRMHDGSLVAVKRMKQKFNSWEQVNTLREVQALRRLNPHPNIITLCDVHYDRDTMQLSLLTELMDMNIYERIKNRTQLVPKSLVKSYTYQLCKALDHMHRNGIFHRDVKPENILIKGNILKLADFGSCRGIYSKPPFTEYIATRWYRPPECLLTDGHYSYKMDIWATGCVFFEIMCLYPLFPGSNEIDQISKIHSVLGTPKPETLQKITKTKKQSFKFEEELGHGLRKYLPYASTDCISLLSGMLAYAPDERFTARECLKHAYFKQLRDADRKRARELKLEREKAEQLKREMHKGNLESKPKLQAPSKGHYHAVAPASSLLTLSNKRSQLSIHRPHQKVHKQEIIRKKHHSHTRVQKLHGSQSHTHNDVSNTYQRNGRDKVRGHDNKSLPPIMYSTHSKQKLSKETRVTGLPRISQNQRR